MDHPVRMFIEEVRKHNNLYDSSSMLYKDGPMTHNSWSEISRNTGLDVAECMKRWKNLRDKYVRRRKKKAAKSEPGPQRVPPYYSFMAWLEPYVKHRKGDSSYQETVRVVLMSN